MQVDVFKCWFMLKALGMEGMEKRINKSFENSRYLAELVENREGFHLLQAVRKFYLLELIKFEVFSVISCEML